MIQPYFLALVIVILNFGAGLVSLVVLRWLAFLGFPTVFFLLLLLIGMPVGGLLLLKIRRPGEGTLLLAAKVFGFLTLASLVFFLIALQWSRHISMEVARTDFLALFRILPVLTLAVASTFFPLFVGYGLMEFAAYRAGVAGLRGNSNLVYALDLFGLLLAFLCHRFLLEPLGTTGLFSLGLVSLGISFLILGSRHWTVFLATVLCASLLFIPHLESQLVNNLQINMGPDTVSYWKPRSKEILYDGWTPHCRLTMLEMGGGIFGFYNGMYYWAYFRGLPGPQENPGMYRRLDMAFTRLVRPGDRVAVLGSGGGVQVAAALRAGANRVVAVDVVPEVLKVLSGPLSGSIEKQYNDPRVELVPKNARRFLEETGESFDIILMERLGGHLTGLRELFEPSQRMFTREALAQVKAHLKPGGILAISDNYGLDRKGIMFAQSFRELLKQGFITGGYVDYEFNKNMSLAFSGRDEPMPPGSYLILAQNGAGQIKALEVMDNFFKNTQVIARREPPRISSPSPATDDFAFATGVLITSLGLPVITTGVVAVSVLLILVGLVLWLVLHKSGHGLSSTISPPGLSVASLAVGFNFMTLEYLMVYRWVDYLDIPMDASFLGIVLFAILAAIGGFILSRWPARFLLAGSGITAIALVLSAFFLPEVSLVPVSIGALFTGSLFPRILKGPDQDLARVYVWDAYGTLWGGFAALCVPLFAGFSRHQALSGLILFIAAWAVDRVSTKRPG